MKKLSEIEITEEIKEKASKCATAEELAALAQEYDVKLTSEEISGVLNGNNIKELSDEDLDKVAGGESGDYTSMHLPRDHGPRISKYAEGYAGRKVYCVRDDDPSQYCWGELVSSSELEIDWLHTLRTHIMSIDGWHNATDTLPMYLCDKKIYEHTPVGVCTNLIIGDECTLYLYKL